MEAVDAKCKNPVYIPPITEAEFGEPVLVANEATVTELPAGTEAVVTVCSAAVVGLFNSLYVGVPIAVLVLLLKFI